MRSEPANSQFPAGWHAPRAALPASRVPSFRSWKGNPGEGYKASVSMPEQVNRHLRRFQACGFTVWCFIRDFRYRLNVGSPDPWPIPQRTTSFGSQPHTQVFMRGFGLEGALRSWLDVWSAWPCLQFLTMGSVAKCGEKEPRLIPQLPVLQMQSLRNATSRFRGQQGTLASSICCGLGCASQFHCRGPSYLKLHGLVASFVSYWD